MNSAEQYNLLIRVLLSDKPYEEFAEAVQGGIMWDIIPEVANLSKDSIWTKLIKYISNLEPILTLRLAALFYYIAKYKSNSESTFNYIRQVLSEFGFSENIINEVSHLVMHHGRIKEATTKVKVIKVVNSAGRKFIDKLIMLAKAEAKCGDNYKNDLAQIEYFKSVLGNLPIKVETPSPTCEKIISVLEPLDFGLVDHSLGVADLFTKLARQMGLPDRDLPNVYIAGLAHDLGKTKWPSEMHFKRPLSGLEWSINHQHALVSRDMVVEIATLPGYLLEAIAQHHERPGGLGKPFGVDPTMFAQMLAVADVYDAMTNERPYRVATYDANMVLDEISRWARNDVMTAFRLLQNSRKKAYGLTAG